MSIDPNTNPTPALQRSAMFSAMVHDTTLRSLRWIEEKAFGSHAFYKHYVPTGQPDICR